MDLEALFKSMPLSYWFFVALLIGALMYFKIKDGDAQVKGGKHRVKNGTLGNASFATEKELDKEYKTILFDPESWRQGKNLPTEPGLLLGDWHKNGKKKSNSRPYYYDKNGNWTGGEVYTRLFTEDQNAAMIAAAGSGKTSFVLAAQLEYAMATGISFLTTDTKGDIVDKYAPLAEQYGYKIVNFDLGHPLRSDRFNILGSVNKYIDSYKRCPDKKSEEALGYLAKAESYAKAAAKTIIMQGTDGNYGANSFFYDSAEGLLQAIILLVAEYAEPDQRHILSVYNVIQGISGTELDAETKTKVSQVKLLLDKLPKDSKIRLFAGSSAQGGDSQASVVSTAMSRLLSFLDSEIEPMLCGESDLDVKKFAKEKTVIFLTVPEEQETRYFLVSLIVQEVYNELLEISRENGNKVPKPEGFNGKDGHQRVEFFLDEIGTLPPIKGMDKILSAGRSRRIFVLNIVQSTSQLEKNYGKSNCEIILANSKLLFVAGLAPLSSDIPRISKILGKYTVTTNSASTSNKPNGGLNKSKSLQMTAIDLMSETEIQQELGLGKVLIIRSGEKPIMSHFDLFLDWGMDLSAPPLTFAAKKAGDVSIADKESIVAVIDSHAQEEKDRIDMQNAQEKADAQKKAEEEALAKREQEQEAIKNVELDVDIPFEQDNSTDDSSNEILYNGTEEFREEAEEAYIKEMKEIGFLTDDEEETSKAEKERAKPTVTKDEETSEVICSFHIGNFAPKINPLYETDEQLNENTSEATETPNSAILDSNEEEPITAENQAETGLELAQNEANTEDDEELNTFISESLISSALDIELIPDTKPISFVNAEKQNEMDYEESIDEEEEYFDEEEDEEW